MRHQDLTLNHRLESWVYANATDRENATGFVAGDIGRIAYQSDSGQYFRLLTVTPTWLLLGSPGSLAYALLQTTQENPTGTATGPVMMGLGVAAGNNAKITPAVSGKLRIAINGNIENSALSTGSFASGIFGTGAAPANGAAQPGGSTGFGYQARRAGPLPANAVVPFSISAAAAGFVVGTQYWFDILLSSAPPGGLAKVSLVTMTVVELP